MNASSQTDDAAREAPRNRPSDSHHGQVGDVIEGRYQVEAVLGRGNWSVVYAAHHMRTQQAVALKMLLRGLPCGDEQAEQRFFREAQVTASLQHPNTLRVYDVGRTDAGALYIVSERLTGLSLEDELADRAKQRRHMTESEALEIADSVLRSLAEAHDRGLVHRDLKPENIFLQEVAGERVVKVMDFGIASLQGQPITARGVSLGTPDYMSPEQCARQDLDGRSDLYALGVLLFRAIAGRVPFIGEDVFDVMRQHREVSPPNIRELRAEVSPGVAMLIERALQKHPDARFADARAMQQAVARAARDLPDALQLRPVSSSRVPRPVFAEPPRTSTGSWRVVAQSEVSAPHEPEAPRSTRVRSTTKYAQVTAQTVAQHRSRAPALDPLHAKEHAEASAERLDGDVSPGPDGAADEPRQRDWVTPAMWVVVALTAVAVYLYSASKLGL